MKRMSVAACSISTICLLGTISFAQQPPLPPGAGMMRMLPVMAALDADQNGEISSDEIAKATQALKTLDKNSDGKLTMEEIRPNMDGMLPGGRRPDGGGFGLGSGGTASGLPLAQSPTDKIDKIMDLDKNGDGRISKEEMPEGARRMLGKADADSDGFLTRDEIEKVADTLPSLGAMGQGTNGSAGARGRFGEGMGMGMFADGPAAMIDRLFRLDADKDGKLTREELSKLKDMFGDRAGSRRGRPGENDPPK
jgi:EF hand